MLNKIVKHTLMAACLLGNTIAMEDNNASDVLIIGCRPWDDNIQDVNGLESAHFVDFRIDGAPVLTPETFHHLDVNNNGPYSQVSEHYNGPLASNFTEFATCNPGKFNTIIIDWITYQHIHRDTAWADFATLLSPGGTLIIPVTRMNFKTGPQSQAAAMELCNKFSGAFSTIDMYGYETMLDHKGVNLLRRAYALEMVTSAQPVIIFAMR